MKIPDTVIDEINRRVNITDVVGDYVTLEQKGSRFMGLCPFHNEKTPSFSVTPEKNLFYCFGCHKGGNMFTFLMEMEHIPFVEAAEKLAQRAGIELNVSDDYAAGQSNRRALEDFYTRLSGSFHYFLTQHEMGKTGREYLVSRGIDEEMIERFQLGFAPPDRRWLFKFLRSKNYSEEFLAKTGLFSKNYPEVTIFSGRVLFPIFDTGGQVIAFGGRSIDGRDPKYINSPDTELFHKRNTLFGLHQSIKGIQKSKRVVVVEGYFDVIALFQAGIPYAVAPLGTALTEEQTRILRRYTQEAVLVFDDDQAGLNAAWRGLEVMEKSGMETYVAVPQGGKDPADIILNEGSNSLKNMLKSPTSGFEFLVKRAVELHGSGNAHSKHRVLSSLAPYLHAVESEVKREEYIKQLANALAVAPEAVNNDLKAILQGKKPRVEGQEASKANKTHIGSDLFLMLVVVVNTDYFSEVRRSITLDDLKDQRARELYIALEEAYRSEELDIDHVIARLEDQDLQRLIFEKIATGEFEVNVENIVKDVIRNIKFHSLQVKRDEVKRKIENIDRKGAHRDALKELLSERMFLDEELKRFKGDVQ